MSEPLCQIQFHLIYYLHILLPFLYNLSRNQVGIEKATIAVVIISNASLRSQVQPSSLYFG
jgi:hypothetical protein